MKEKAFKPLQTTHHYIYNGKKMMKEDKMKKLSITSAMILLLAIPVLNQVAQEIEITPDEVDFEEYVLNYVPVLPQIQSPDHNPYVKALCIGLANYYPSQADFAILDFVTKWNSSQDWDILFVVVNYSSQAVKVVVEMEMMFNDGQNRLYKKSKKTIDPGNVMLYTYDVTNKVASGYGDLFTVNGRIWGAGMGNSNEVKSQVYIY